jgi:hypothetical protein
MLALPTFYLDHFGIQLTNISQILRDHAREHWLWELIVASERYALEVQAELIQYM